MSQILVRDLDPEVVEQLKQRAKRNRRSLQAEVKVILEGAARARLNRREFVEIMERIREASGPQTSDSVDLVREDRER